MLYTINITYEIKLKLTEEKKRHIHWRMKIWLKWNGIKCNDIDDVHLRAFEFVDSSLSIYLLCFDGRVCNV